MIQDIYYDLESNKIKYDKVTYEFIWEIKHFKNVCHKWWRKCCSKRKFFL